MLSFHLTMLFKELIEQHRVHRFVTDNVRLALIVASDEIRIHLFHLPGDQAKLRDALGIRLTDNAGLLNVAWSLGYQG